MANQEINLFGEVNFRGQSKRFGIKTDDRRRHVYVIGKTGMGKTTLLENMVVNDIMNGHGVGVVDPHGEFAEKILEFIPKERVKDVVYFNPADLQFPIAFNPIEKISVEMRHLVASGLMGVFKKIWPDVWSARMEYILNNSLLSLLEFPDATVLDVMRLMSDKDYRKGVVDQLKDPVIKSFWVNEFARYAQKFETEATAAIQNKIGKFVSNPLVRHILGQPRSALDFRKAMDEKKILIFNLSKGRIGEDNSALLGAMIITKLQLAAMSRVDTPENERNDFYLYVDEFQNFATDSFANILSEARKYRLCLILAHQYIGQLVHEMNTRVRDAVFGNVGTMIVFRVGAEDAEFLEKEFEPDFMATDLVNLTKANVYLKLMIDGVSSRPFSARGMPPIQRPAQNHVQEIIEQTRKIYATPLKEVEEKIASVWSTPPPEDVAERPRRPYTDMRRAPGEYAPRAIRPMYPPRRDESRLGPPREERSYRPRITDERPAHPPERRQEQPRPVRPAPAAPSRLQQGGPAAPAPPKMSLKELKPKAPEPEKVKDDKKKVDVEGLKKALLESLNKNKKPE